MSAHAIFTADIEQIEKAVTRAKELIKSLREEATKVSIGAMQSSGGRPSNTTDSNLQASRNAAAATRAATLEIQRQTAEINRQIAASRQYEQASKTATAQVKQQTAVVQQSAAALKEQTALIQQQTASTQNQAATLRTVAAATNAQTATINQNTAAFRAQAAQVAASTATVNNQTAQVRLQTTTINQNTAQVRLQTQQQNLSAATSRAQTAAINTATAGINQQTASIRQQNAGLQQQLLQLRLATAQQNALSNATRNGAASGLFASQAFQRFRATLLAFATGYIVIQGLFQGFRILKEAVIDYNAILQTSTISLTQMFEGNKQKAESLLQTLQKFAAITPFQYKELVPLAQRLVAAGISAENGGEKIIYTLRAIGDAGAALGKNMEDTNQKVDQLSTAFLVLAERGALTGRAYNQFATAGIDVVKYLAQAYASILPKGADASRIALQQLVSKGMIPAKNAIEAITAGIENDPLRAGLMQKQSQTFTTAISNIWDGFNRAVGNSSKKAFDQLTKLAVDVAAVLTSDRFQRMAETFGAHIYAGMQVAGEGFVIFWKVVSTLFPYIIAYYALLEARTVRLMVIQRVAALQAARDTGASVATQIRALTGVGPMFLAVSATVAIFIAAFKYLPSLRPIMRGVFDGIIILLEGVSVAFTGLIDTLNAVLQKIPDIVLKTNPVGWMELQIKRSLAGIHFGDLSKGMMDSFTEMRANFDAGWQSMSDAADSDRNGGNGDFLSQMFGVKNFKEEIAKALKEGTDEVNQYFQKNHPVPTYGADNLYPPRNAAQIEKSRQEHVLAFTEKFYDSMARMAEESAKRQIDAFKTGTDKLRDLFGGAQEDLLKLGIVNDPLGPAIKAFESRMNLSEKIRDAYKKNYDAILEFQIKAAQAKKERDKLTGGAGQALGLDTPEGDEKPNFDGFPAPVVGANKTSAPDTSQTLLPVSTLLRTVSREALNNYFHPPTRKLPPRWGSIQTHADQTPLLLPANPLQFKAATAASHKNTQEALAEALGIDPQTIKQSMQDIVAGIDTNLSKVSILPKSFGPPLHEMANNVETFRFQMELSNRATQAMLRTMYGANFDKFVADTRKMLEGADNLRNKAMAENEFMSRIRDLNIENANVGHENDPIFKMQTANRFDLSRVYMTEEAKWTELQQLRKKIIDETNNDSQQFADAQKKQQDAIVAGIPFLKADTDSLFDYQHALDAANDALAIYNTYKDRIKPGLDPNATPDQIAVSNTAINAGHSDFTNQQATKQQQAIRDNAKAMADQVNAIKLRGEMMAYEQGLMAQGVIDEGNLSKAIEIETQKRQNQANTYNLLKSIMPDWLAHIMAQIVAQRLANQAQAQDRQEHINANLKEYNLLLRSTTDALLLAGKEQAAYLAQSDLPTRERHLALLREEYRLRQEAREKHYSEDDIQNRLGQFAQGYDATNLTKAIEQYSNLRSELNKEIFSFGDQSGLAATQFEILHGALKPLNQDLQDQIGMAEAARLGLKDYGAQFQNLIGKALDLRKALPGKELFDKGADTDVKKQQLEWDRQDAELQLRLLAMTQEQQMAYQRMAPAIASLRVEVLSLLKTEEQATFLREAEQQKRLMDIALISDAYDQQRAEIERGIKQSGVKNDFLVQTLADFKEFQTLLAETRKQSQQYVDDLDKIFGTALEEKYMHHFRSFFGQVLIGFKGMIEGISRELLQGEMTKGFLHLFPSVAGALKKARDDSSDLKNDNRTTANEQMQDATHLDRLDDNGVLQKRLKYADVKGQMDAAVAEAQVNIEEKTKSSQAALENIITQTRNTIIEQDKLAQQSIANSATTGSKELMEMAKSVIENSNTTIASATETAINAIRAEFSVAMAALASGQTYGDVVNAGIADSIIGTPSITIAPDLSGGPIPTPNPNMPIPGNGFDSFPGVNSRYADSARIVSPPGISGALPQADDTVMQAVAASIIDSNHAMVQTISATSSQTNSVMSKVDMTFEKLAGNFLNAHGAGGVGNSIASGIFGLLGIGGTRNSHPENGPVPDDSTPSGPAPGLNLPGNSGVDLPERGDSSRYAVRAPAGVAGQSVTHVYNIQALHLPNVEKPEDFAPALHDRVSRRTGREQIRYGIGAQ